MDQLLLNSLWGRVKLEHLKSFKLNAVFRWEIKSGSNFYAVWTPQQEDARDPGHFVFGRDTGNYSGRRAMTSFW